MGAYDTWRKYVAITRHFSSWKYDARECDFRLKQTTTQLFSKKNDAWIWQKLDQRIDAANFMVSHRLLAPDQWIGEAVHSQETEALHTERLKRVYGLSYYLKQDLNHFEPDGFGDVFKVTDGQHPLILKMHWEGVVSLETVTVLAKLANCVQYWKRTGDGIVKRNALRVHKYWTWLDVDEEKMRKIVIGHFRS